MMDLPVDTVLAAAKDLLKATEPQAQGQDG
jgi:hypothetical protein